MSNEAPQFDITPQTADAVKAAYDATKGDFHSPDASLVADIRHPSDPGLGMDIGHATVRASVKGTGDAVLTTDKFAIRDVYSPNSQVELAGKSAFDIDPGVGDGSVAVTRTNNGETATRHLTGKNAERATRIIMNRVAKSAAETTETK